MARKRSRKPRPKSITFQRSKKLGIGKATAKLKITPKGRKKVKASVSYEA